jgi:peptidyl-prolyl cis-trans isomerase D
MFEPAVVGAIALSEANASGIAKGGTAAVVYVVDGVAVDAEGRTAEAEKERLQATSEAMSVQYALRALQEMVEIEDLRGKYF